ncbi:hypothetical protein MNB_SV-6-1546 [hydrothermal vent metagenome]|uniref:Uncharacterized protein n=1 Tax=hydrothermal vent metagenome TaxID=652676 RepID=A0A1W1CFH7_9ZZZZ
MNEKTTQIEEIPLSGTKDGKISIATIDKPYGEDSDSVVSIAIALQGDTDEPDWKVHLPKGDIDAVISALKKAKESIS